MFERAFRLQIPERSSRFIQACGFPLTRVRENTYIARPMTSSRYCLVVALPEGSVKHFLLSADEVTIGRGSGSAIVLDWETISNRHCLIRRAGDGFEIVDLGSTNGTKVKGQTVKDSPIALSDGDAIAIGPNVKARLVAIEEITNEDTEKNSEDGSRTQRLKVNPKLPEMPSINPVAAAVAKAGKEKG